MRLDAFEWLMLITGAPLLLFLLWMLFVMLPVALVADAKCLERGYPKSSVTWNFKRYCMNLEGTVTVTVDSIP